MVKLVRLARTNFNCSGSEWRKSWNLRCLNWWFMDRMEGKTQTKEDMENMMMRMVFRDSKKCFLRTRRRITIEGWICNSSDEDGTITEWERGCSWSSLTLVTLNYEYKRENSVKMSVNMTLSYKWMNEWMKIKNTAVNKMCKQDDDVEDGFSIRWLL